MRKCIRFTVTFFLVIVTWLLTNKSYIYGTVFDSDLGYTESEKMHSGDYKYMYDDKGVATISIEIIDKLKSYNKISESKETVIDGANRCFTIRRASNSNEKFIVTLEVRKFNSLSSENKLIATNQLYESRLYSELTEENKERLYNMILNNVDMSVSLLINSTFGNIKPDIVGGYLFIRPFGSKLGVFLGVICILLSTLAIVSVIIDIVFFFVLSSTCESRPRLVSPMAYKTYRKGIDNNRTTAVILLSYAIRRFSVLLLLVITISYLTENILFKMFVKLIGLFRGI